MAVPSPLRATFVLAGLFAAAMGMIYPLVFQHLEVTFDASPTVIGVVAAASGAVQVAIRIPVGRHIDLRGEAGVLGGSWLILALAGVLFLVATSVALVTLAFVVLSTAIAGFWVASNALVARLAPPGELARTMTRYMIALGSGFALGAPLGGLADLLGFEAALSLALPLGLVGFFSFARVAALPPQVLSHAVLPARHPGLWLGMLSAFYFGVVLGAADTFIPVHLAAAGLTALSVGLFFSWRELTNLVSRLATVRAVRDETAALFLGLGALAEAVGLVAFPRATGPLVLGLVAIAMGLGVGLMGPASLTLAARGTPSGRTGRAMGAYGTALSVGLVIGPAALGPVGDGFGIARIFDVVAALSALMALICLWVAAHDRSRAPP